MYQRPKSKAKNYKTFREDASNMHDLGFDNILLDMTSNCCQQKRKSIY